MTKIDIAAMVADREEGGEPSRWEKHVETVVAWNLSRMPRLLNEPQAFKAACIRQGATGMHEYYKATILSLAAENERLRETLGRTAEQALMEEIPEHSRGSFDDAAFNRGYDAAISAARSALTGSQP